MSAVDIAHGQRAIEGGAKAARSDGSDGVTCEIRDHGSFPRRGPAFGEDANAPTGRAI